MNKAEEFLKGKMDDFNTRHLLDKLDPIYQGVLIGLMEQYAQQGEKPELINETYYLVLTVENKWGIAYWKDKWWDSPEQDFKLAFGLKDEWIKTWYNLPNHQNQ